jgi:hypothetical protein
LRCKETGAFYTITRDEMKELLDLCEPYPKACYRLAPRDNKEIMRSNNGRRLERNRKFVDSPLEEAVSSEPVSETPIPC